MINEYSFHPNSSANDMGITKGGFMAMLNLYNGGKVINVKNGSAIVQVEENGKKNIKVINLNDNTALVPSHAGFKGETTAVSELINFICNKNSAQKIIDDLKAYKHTANDNYVNQLNDVTNGLTSERKLYVNGEKSNIINSLNKEVSARNLVDYISSKDFVNTTANVLETSRVKTY